MTTGVAEAKGREVVSLDAGVDKGKEEQLTNDVCRRTTSDLCTQTVVPDLGARLPPRLDRDRDNLLLLFAAEQPSGHLELLGRAVEQVLERDGQRPVDVVRLGLLLGWSSSAGHAAEPSSAKVVHPSAEGVAGPSASTSTSLLVHEHADESKAYGTSAPHFSRGRSQALTVAQEEQELT